MKFAPLAVFLVAVAVAAGCKKPRAQAWPPSMRTTAPDSPTALVHDAKGDVVLLVLYASWCTGCRDELKAVDRLALKYEGKGLRVVPLALDDDPQDFAELLDEQKLHLDLVRVAPLDDAKLTEAVRNLGGRYAQSIPYTALFDRSGKLAREWNGDGSRELEAAITSLL